MTKRFKRWISFVMLTCITAGSLIWLSKFKDFNKEERHKGSVAVEEIAKEIKENKEKEVEDVKQEPTPEPEIVYDTISLVTSTGLNMRSAPEKGDNVIDVIPEGTTLKLYDKVYNDEWYEVANGDGKLDYVNKNYLVTEEGWDEILAERKKEAEEKAKELAKKKKSNPTTKLSRGGEVPEGRQIKVEVSHYCSCSKCSEGYGGQTASGSGVYVGAIAAPAEFPLGTKMLINGNMYTVEDRGGYIVKTGDTYRIDIYVPSHSEAMRKGRYRTTALVY